MNSLDGKVFNDISAEDRATKGKISVEALQVDNNASHEVRLAFETAEGNEHLKATVHVFPTGMLISNRFLDGADSYGEPEASSGWSNQQIHELQSILKPCEKLARTMHRIPHEMQEAYNGTKTPQPPDRCWLHYT